MTFRTYVNDRFSPYLDDDPWVDFFDDLAQRSTTIATSVIAVHIALFFAMQANFIVPDLKEEEPEPIPVQIIAFENLKADPEPPAEVIDITPAVPAQAPPPRVKPRPKPQPQPQPQAAPPPPPVQDIAPDPIPEPEPVITPPPPDILVNETPAETENTIPDFTPPEPISEPVIEPPVIPEPVPQAVPEPEIEIEIFEPIAEPVIEPAPTQTFEIEIFEPEPVPEPVVEPIPEPLPELEPLPIIEPEPLAEPIIEPEPIIEETLLPEITELETAPIITPEPIEIAPAPGPVIEQEIIIREIDLNPLVTTPEPEITPVEPSPPVETEPEPEELELEDAPIITTAPTILASPDAPVTSEEAEKAVPQEQAAPLNDFLFKPKTGFPQPAAPRGGSRPSTSAPSGNSGGGGGAISLDGGGAAPPGGGTRLGSSRPSGGGWTYAPSGSTGGFGEGGKGLVLDIRCREAKRTHADCPAYLAKFKGRNASGFESFGAHSNGGGGSARSARSGTSENPAVGGGRDPWSLGPGSNSVNAGGPSSTVLDDADFGREFLGTNLGDGSQSGRLRDLIKSPEKPWEEKIIELPAAPEEEDSEGGG